MSIFKGLNNKTKLTIYKTFGGEVKFKRYLNGVGDAGTPLLFKLRSGTHGLNEELGRHRGREGKYMCNLCGEDCESVGHFLWNCPVYSERRALFLEHLKNNLGNEFEHFKSCDIAGKSHFILGTELWGSRYKELLRLVKSYIIDIWELRKTLHARARVSLVSWEGRSHALLFMVPLGLPSARRPRPMAQALRLPFEYYILLLLFYIIILIILLF